MEMIVAVALFAIVMLVSVGALLALVGANRKAQASQSVMNNLNIALEGMVRAVRMGSEFHCGPGTITATQSCESSGDTRFAFKPFCQQDCDASTRWVYAFDTDGSYCGSGRLCKSEDSGSNYYAVTAPEVTIENMTFYVIGTTAGDTTQPKVVLEIKGSAGSKQVKTKTIFNIQATAVQRILDL